MTTTDDPSTLLDAAKRMARMLGEPHTAMDVAGQLTCPEADAVAWVMAVAGCDTDAANWIAAHAQSDDDPDDRHTHLREETDDNAAALDYVTDDLPLHCGE